MHKIDPELLLEAYKLGFFPMAEAADSAEILWFDPEVRGILPLEAFHVPRRLARTLRQNPFQITVDQDFMGVIRACAAAREKTWINRAIIDAYEALHKKGHAHSVEARDGKGELVGGLYGVAIGGAFFGESMFSGKRDASKLCLIHLVTRLKDKGFTLLDAQFFNPHLVQFGLTEIPRDDYKKILAQAVLIGARF